MSFSFIIKLISISLSLIFIFSSSPILAKAQSQSSSDFLVAFSQADITECGETDIIWSGGVGGISLVIVPVSDSTRTLQLPVSTTSSSNIFSYQVNYPAGTRLLMVLEDSTGKVGGASELKTVKPAINGNSCDLRDPTNQFSFNISTPQISQCNPTTFSWTEWPTPVYCYVIVPGGKVFRDEPVNGSTAWTWPANVPSGTEVMVAMMSTSRKASGGTSSLLQVQQSQNNSCLGSDALTTTFVGNPTITVVAASATITTGGENRGGGGGGLSTTSKIVIGTVIGGVAVIVAILLWQCARLRERRRGKIVNLAEDSGAEAVRPFVTPGTDSNGGQYMQQRGGSVYGSGNGSEMEYNPNAQQTQGLLSPSPIHSPTTASGYQPNTHPAQSVAGTSEEGYLLAPLGSGPQSTISDPTSPTSHSSHTSMTPPGGGKSGQLPVAHQRPVEGSAAAPPAYRESQIMD